LACCPLLHSNPLQYRWGWLWFCLLLCYFSECCIDEITFGVICSTTQDLRKCEKKYKQHDATTANTFKWRKQKRQPARSEGESGDDRLPSPTKFLPNSRLSCPSSLRSLTFSPCSCVALTVGGAFTGKEDECDDIDADVSDINGWWLDDELRSSLVITRMLSVLPMLLRLLPQSVSHWRISSPKTMPLPVYKCKSAD
jgi:hypothetical protein